MVNVLIENGVARADAYLLDCPAVHEMARTIARAKYVSLAERRLLLADIAESTPPLARFEPRSARFAIALMSLTGLALLILCTGIWRFLT